MSPLEAGDAFGKAIRAWHNGIEVKTIKSRPTPSRISSRLPAPRPLPSAISAGNFGHDEHGNPIRPGPDEIRAITEHHAEKLIELLYVGKDIQPALAKYAEDFGERPAKQLEAYIRRQDRTRSR